MNDSHPITCPYCWQTIHIELDHGLVESDGVTETFQPQTYVEDCHVCCRPIKVVLKLEGGMTSIEVMAEND